MDGILILAHGSRKKETEKTLESVVGKVKKALPCELIEIAYMEFGNINIEKGIDILVERGVDTIKIIPYFLFEGIHIKEDIPQEIENYKKKNNNINIALGNVLGDDDRLAEILVDRILEI